MKPIKQVAISSLVFLFVGLLLGAFFVYAQTPSSTFTISSGIYPCEQTYTIWSESSNYFAKDHNGLMAYSGTNISDIVNTIITSKGTGGVAIVFKGDYGTVYTFTNPIVIPSGYAYVQLRGEGRPVDIVFKAANNYAYSAIVLVKNGVRQLTIENLGFDGNKANNAGQTFFGIYFEYLSSEPSNDCHIVNNIIVNFPSHGIFVESNLAASEIRRNYVEMNTGAGIKTLKLQNSIISDNILWDNDCCGLEMDGTGTDKNVDNIITNNVISLNDWDGIRLQFGGNTLVSNNKILSNGMQGISLNTFHRATITGNSVSTNGYHGIYIMYSLHTCVSGNTVFGNSALANNTYNGIHIGGSADFTSSHVTVGDNVVSSVNYAAVTAYGLFVDGAYANYTICLGVNAVGSGTADIYSTGATNKVNLCYNGTTWIP